MRIEQFSVTQLHGFLDIDLTFNEDLTIIVGRNGSGKTSTLNLVSDLLRLDIKALRRTPFARARVSLIDPLLGRVCIWAQKDGPARNLGIEIGNAKAEIPLDISADVSNWASVSAGTYLWVPEAPDFTSTTVNYPHVLSVDASSWLKLSRQFADTTRLTFVRLDRSIVAVDPEGAESVDAPRPKNSRSGSASDPIDEVVKVTTRRFAEYKRRVEDIKNNAFNELLKLHFAPLDPAAPKTKSSQTQLQTKVQQLRRRVEGSSLFSDSPVLQAASRAFFQSLSEVLSDSSASAKKRIGRRSLQEESKQILIGLKESQIEKLVKIFDEEQDASHHAYRPIKRYLDATMKFLRESGKQLEFDPSFQLGFSVPSAPSGSDGNERQKHRGLKELASGERQVLIVLTYLAFLAGEGSIFVVDEPELSLHLRWQSYLIDALKELRPENCQIIVATHAPEIAGRAKNKIILLRPSYLPSEPA